MNKTIFVGIVIVVLAVSLVASTMTIASATTVKKGANSHISAEGRLHMSETGRIIIDTGIPPF